MKHFDSVIAGKALAESCAAVAGDKRVCADPMVSGALNGLFAL